MVKFSRERYDKITEDCIRWWNRELKRPLIQVRMAGADPGRPAPDRTRGTHELTYDPAVPPEVIIDRLDYDLSRITYMGDAFPYTSINLGPGVVTAFANDEVRATVAEDTVSLPSGRQIEWLRFREGGDFIGNLRG